MVSVGGTLSVAPTPQVSLGLGLNRNRVKVPSGEFTADLLSLRGTYSFSTRLSANLLVQYNSLDEVLLHQPQGELHSPPGKRPLPGVHRGTGGRGRPLGGLGPGHGDEADLPEAVLAPRLRSLDHSSSDGSDELEDGPLLLRVGLQESPNRRIRSEEVGGVNFFLHDLYVLKAGRA